MADALKRMMKVSAVEGYRVPHFDLIEQNVFEFLKPGEAIEVPADPHWVNELRAGKCLKPECAVARSFAPVAAVAAPAGKKADK